MPAPLRIVVAPDAFKESMTSADAARAIARGVRKASESSDLTLETIEVPISDGGAGFVEALAASSPSDMVHRDVTGPLGQRVRASFALIEREGGPVAAMQMSSAAGLHLVPAGQRNPLRTSTWGVGELVSDAIDRGAREIIIGVGNSATCDAGAGMAAALGAQFLDNHSEPVLRPVGADLIRIVHIDASILLRRIDGVRFTVACDVDNPLFGPRGSAHVFAPQKGADPEQVEHLDAGLSNFAARMEESGLPFDPDTPGAGAAGGIAYGLGAFCSAALRPGADIVLDAARFDDQLRGAALLLTGEGRLDGTSLAGKAAYSAAKRAQRAGIPSAALVGSLGEGHGAALSENGGPFSMVEVITPPDTPRPRALRRAPDFLEAAAARAVTRWLASRGPFQ